MDASVSDPSFADRLAALREQTARVDPAIASLRYLVVGGTGFVGQYLVEELLARGAAEVRILCRTRPDDDDARDARITYAIGSVTDGAVVAEACEGIDAVFHTAANYGTPNFGRYGDGKAVYATNVGGVQNVIAACENKGVKTLIYTSSVNVVFDGRPSVEVDEDAPYAEPSRVDHYSRSKCLAEQKVLAASSDSLTTCALRPNGIYGPREDFITQKVLGLVRWMRGLPFALDRAQRTDWTFVYNLVWAHLLCMATPPEQVRAKAFFITDGEAVHTMDGFMDAFLAPLGFRVRRIVPVPSFLMTLGCTLSEWLCHVLSPIVRIAPAFTRAEAQKAVATNTHSIERARAVLGYEPLISTSEGLRYMSEELVARRALRARRSS